MLTAADYYYYYEAAVASRIELLCAVGRSLSSGDVQREPSAAKS